MAASIAKFRFTNFRSKIAVFSSLRCARLQPVTHNIDSYRGLSSFSKNKLSVDPAVEAKYEDATSFRQHPGAMDHSKQAPLTVKLQNTLNKVVSRYADAVGDLASLAENLNNYLSSRHAPVEKRELQLKAVQYEKECLADIKDLALKSEEEMEKIQQQVKGKVMKKLKQHTYRWEAINYNPKNAFVYLATRAVADYASIYKIFNEIKKRDPEFRPRGYYDFGSGVGTGMWALSAVWPNQTVEYYNVDVSDDMHTLSRLVLQDGEENKEMSLKPVYYRQFSPGSHKQKYELVVSAYTLLELSDKSSRIKAVMDLWKKTDGYLVLVEAGTKAGFRLIREARDAILKSCEMSKHTELSPQDKEYDVTYEGHVFAPCPHDVTCPWPQDGKTPCNFEAAYPTPAWTKTWSKAKKASTKSTSRFSYVVFKKGPRIESSVTWPRVIRPVSTPSRHVHCRLCCQNGKLEHHVLTQRQHGKTLYKCARASKWGDLLPASLTETSEHHSNAAKTDDHHSNAVTDESFSPESGLKANDHDKSNDSILVMGNSEVRHPDIRTLRGLTLSGEGIVQVVRDKTNDSCHSSKEKDDSEDVTTSPLPT